MLPPVQIADPSSEADAINDAGLVVGMTSGSDFVPHAFTWQAGVRTDIGTGWIPRAVADTGHIAAFLWQSGMMTALANPYGGDSAARDINARGEIVGWAADRNGDIGGVRWRGRSVTFLGATVIQDAAAINDRGDIVGNTYVGADLHARLWQDGRVTDLGSMGHKGPNGDSYTRADDLTDDGLITGDSYGADGIRHAFVWNAGKYTDLGQGLAVGITATGTVAGNAAEFPRVGLVWQPLS